jgi:thioredoxin 1
MSKFNELINGQTPVLVDFFAEWCGPCKTMAPILSQVSQQLKGKAKIIKVDVDKNPEAAGKYRILSVPTLMLFQNGEMKWKQSGVVQQQDLLNVINQYT